MSTPHNEPNESSLRPPEDTADDDSSFLSSSRSRSSAETTIRGPATNFHQRTPAYTYYNRKRLRRLLAVKRSTRRKANDPYDYEQKYPEDEEFHEMGPRARIWKIFWDECTKYDSDMVEDWRDGLDVLLVFAGLFSAVVSTFVAQTCQSIGAKFRLPSRPSSFMSNAPSLKATTSMMSLPLSLIRTPPFSLQGRTCG
ncbi:hypothetical protein CPB85DRAFT_412083 [Mucidula mucida]|nr:hypothetical protein CPB85DRAFT_412083 [Mucidula mucida]